MDEMNKKEIPFPEHLPVDGVAHRRQPILLLYHLGCKTGSPGRSQEVIMVWPAPGLISRKRNFRWCPEIFCWIVLLVGVAFWVSTPGYALDSSRTIVSVTAAIQTKAHRFRKLLDQAQK